KAAGYDGWLSLEFEGHEDNLPALRRGLAYLKRFA
ncbi:MAG: sugar phosphate isomerase/epimerase, partial [Clostridiales bacterium]|nr:sugar phosphate isomerase/epimerase [Clostridiales bacterium]